MPELFFDDQELYEDYLEGLNTAWQVDSQVMFDITLKDAIRNSTEILPAFFHKAKICHLPDDGSVQLNLGLKV